MTVSLASDTMGTCNSDNDKMLGHMKLHQINHLQGPDIQSWINYSGLDMRDSYILTDSVEK